MPPVTSKYNAISTFSFKSSLTALQHLLFSNSSKFFLATSPTIFRLQNWIPGNYFIHRTKIHRPIAPKSVWKYFLNGKIISTNSNAVIMFKITFFKRVNWCIQLWKLYHGGFKRWLQILWHSSHWELVFSLFPLNLRGVVTTSVNRIWNWRIQLWQ